MIIQGANEPIVLIFKGDMSEMQDFSSVLVNKSSLEVMKHWTKGDISIGEPYEDEETEETLTPVTLPLEQDETILFKHGTAILQTKWLMEGTVWNADDQEIHVKRTFDETLLVRE